MGKDAVPLKTWGAVFSINQAFCVSLCALMARSPLAHTQWMEQAAGKSRVVMNGCLSTLPRVSCVY